MPLADLGFRHVMAAGPHAVPDPFDGKVFRDEQHVQHDGEAGAAGGVQQVQLDGWENTVSAMNDRPRSISFARVSAATFAAS